MSNNQYEILVDEGQAEAYWITEFNNARLHMKMVLRVAATDLELLDTFSKCRDVIIAKALRAMEQDFMQLRLRVDGDTRIWSEIDAKNKKP